MPQLEGLFHRGHCVHQQFWTQRPCQKTLSTLSGDQTVGVRHRQPLKVDWKLEAHSGWLESMVRRRQLYHRNQARGVRNPVYVVLMATRFFIKYCLMRGQIVSRTSSVNGVFKPGGLPSENSWKYTTIGRARVSISNRNVLLPSR